MSFIAHSNGSLSDTPWLCCYIFIFALAYPQSLIWQSQKGSCESPTGLGKIWPALFAAVCPWANKQRQESTKQAKCILECYMSKKAYIELCKQKSHNGKHTRKPPAIYPTFSLGKGILLLLYENAVKSFRKKKNNLMILFLERILSQS